MATSDGRASNDNKQVGTSIEKYRARRRDGQRTPEAWFDVEAADGTLVEVKSTERRVDIQWAEDRDPRRGRFQLVQENHENLVDHGGEYDFVLRDGDDAVAETTISAKEVDNLLDENGRTWPAGSKLKLVWSDIFDPEDVPRE